MGYGKVMGILGRYNGTWQLTIRTIDDVYGFDGKPVDGTGGDTPSDDLTTIFSETFESSQGDFTIEDKHLGTGISYVWTHDSDYGYMKASAFAGSSVESESWLISPVVDLTGATNCQLSFTHVGNFFKGTMPDNAKVWGRAEGGTWTELTIDKYPASDSWDSDVTGTVDLSQFDGQRMQFAFVYTSSSSVAGTWEVEDIEVKGNK